MQKKNFNIGLSFNNKKCDLKISFDSIISFADPSSNFGLNYHFNKTLVKMRYGGTSNKNISSIINQNIQILRFLKIDKNLYRICIFFINKFFNRLKQFVIKE